MQPSPDSILPIGSKGNPRFVGLGYFVAFFLLTVLSPRSGEGRTETLDDQVRRFTSALSSRNLDSIRMMIDPNKIFVEIAPKEGAYLSASQTLAVVESFLRTHLPQTFSYIRVLEEGKTGIATGLLTVLETGRKVSHKVSFGFLKTENNYWLLSRITIR